ncbi:MAG TPA: PEP-CTERM sorting domain-containing protein [Tepidisphaeraceae bacterium]|jgi:hypothetical protein|nr:PEP-CTERM sorting domain-containing protein [Tepidisphaeraceae bacterium]
MPISRLKLAVLSAVAAIGVVGSYQANAAVVYSYTTDQPDYSVAPGGTAVVKLYLQESGSPSFITSDGGLFAAGNEVDFVSSSASTPATITGQAPNTTDFGGPTSNTVSKTQSVLIMAIASPPAPDVQLQNTGGGASPNTLSNEVYIGSITITAGSSGVTHYTVGAVNDPQFGIGEVTLTKSQADLDLGTDSLGNPLPNVTGVNSTLTPFTVTVGAAPEPASLGLLACGGLLALRRRRRA